MIVQNTAVSDAFLRHAYAEWLLTNGIRDDDELQYFCEIYLNFLLPRTPFCEGHQSPFAFLADQFFERTKTAFGFANRSGGKTRTVAILNVLDLLFKPGVEVCSAGAIQQQADRGYEYLIEMLRTPPLDEMLLSSTKSETRLVNGSLARIIVATYFGLNSPHPQKFRVDEIELIHPTLLQEAFSMSQAKGDFKAQDTLTSTRKFAAGPVQRLLDEAETRGIKIYRWCIWETLEKCTRKCKNDPTYGNCPAYSRLDKDGNERFLCGIDPATSGKAEPTGKAHHVPGGWYHLEDFIKKVALLDRDTFETQWLNLRPNAGALVYGEWFRDDPPFVVPTEECEKLLARFVEEKNWPRVYGIDFGSHFACSMWMQDPVDLCWYNYDEYFFTSDSDRPLSEHSKAIIQKDRLGFDPKRVQVFGDPSGRQAIRDLETFGIFCTSANNDVYAGINHIKRLLQREVGQGKPKLRVFSSCARLRKEMAELYTYKLSKDGTINRDEIQKKNDHMSDAMRYSLYSYETIGTGRYRMRKLRGVW